MVEVGVKNVIKLTPVYSSGDSTGIDTVTYYKGNSILDTEITPIAITDNTPATKGTITYKVTVAYKGNAGVNLPAGHVTATKSITGDYYSFSYASNTVPTTGQEIRNAGSIKTFSNSFTLNSGDVATVFVIAVPQGKRVKKIIDTGGAIPIEMKIGNEFIQSSISTIPDANGDPANYSVYVCEMTIPYSKNHPLDITLE